MANKRYTKEMLQEAVNASKNWSDVCKYFGLKYNGGNNDHLKKKAEKFGVNFDHFLGQAWTRNKELFNRRKSVDDYLVVGKTSSTYLKKILIREGIFNHQCSNCNLEEWLGDKIPLQLDHIDGNNENNTLENLRLLCPNCHALTDTYCGKNVKNRTKSHTTLIAKAK